VDNEKELRIEAANKRLAALWDEGLASGPSVDGPSALAEIGAKLEARILQLKQTKR
jgi:hypothetical protein